MARSPRQFELAPRDRLDAVAHLAARFFHEVVGWDYAEVLVTDESDLRDFVEIGGNRKSEVAQMLDRISLRYGVDARQAASTRIVDLLELLHANGVTG